MAQNKCTMVLESILKWCFVIPVTLLIFIGVIILPLLFTPFYLYRYCLKLSSKLFRRDLANLLPSGNAIMVSYDQVYGRNDNTTVIAMKVAGSLDIDLVRQVVTEKLINAKSRDGSLKYPELKQFPFRWLGYYFWKPELNFDINSHVQFYSPPEEGKFYSDEDAALVEAELVTKDHIKKTSPWQIIILPNVKSKPEDDPQSNFYFRTHHGLMDGFALVQLIFGDLGGVDPKKLGVSPPNLSCKEKLQTFLYYSMQYLRLPFDIAYCTVLNITSGRNDFRKEYADLSREQIGTKSLRIPLDYLKEIRKSLNVDLGSVIIASFVGGLRRTMLDLNMKIPKLVLFGYPWPIPGHPGKLRVHASAATLSFPIGIKDPVERLKEIDNLMKKIKHSSYPQALFIFRAIIGSLPAFFIDALIPRQPPTGAMNIFASLSQPFSIFGKVVTEMHFSYGQQKFRSSVLFSSLSYSGTVAMKIAVNKNIFPNQSGVCQFNQFVLEELELLSKSVLV